MAKLPASRLKKELFNESIILNALFTVLFKTNRLNFIFKSGFLKGLPHSFAGWASLLSFFILNMPSIDRFKKVPLNDRKASDYSFQYRRLVLLHHRRIR